MGRNARLLSFLSACAATVASPALGAELKWTHFGVRPLAMGNAYVAVADDFNALFYNPAGLARLKSWSGEFLNPQIEISTNTIKAIKDVQELTSSDTNDKLDFLEKNTGKTHHFSFGLTPHLVFPGFGFGVGAELGSTLAIHREISTDVDIGLNLIAPVAYARNFLEDRLSIGGAVKFVARGGVDRQFSINDIEALKTNDDKEKATGEDSGPTLEDFVEGGTGLGADFGLLFTPIKTLEPTLGLSVTDIGGTPYKKSNVQGEALGTPDVRLPSVNTGVSLLPWQTSSMYLRTSVDAHAINHPVHYSKKFNLGAEWGLGEIIKVQAGLHQGELSGGFQFDVMLFTLRFASYTEQLGTIAGQDDNLRDRRYAMQLKLLF